MTDTMTETELITQLSSIKQTLDYAKKVFHNIIFFNNQSFYFFLKQLKCDDGQTIGAILDQLEQCIPFALTDDSFSLFLSSCQSDSYEKMEALRKGFIESSKNDFLLHLLSISDEIQWQHILDTCEMLRKKNRNLFLQSRKERL